MEHDQLIEEMGQMERLTTAERLRLARYPPRSWFSPNVNLLNFPFHFLEALFYGEKAKLSFFFSVFRLDLLEG
jgi:hypothetical protein